MIADRFEQLVLLVQGQRISSDLIWTEVIPLVPAFFVLALVADYGYMIYLHFKMASLPKKHTHLLPPSKPWIYFEALSQKYNSPIITFWTGRRPTIWLNDAWTASDLLDKRAAIYASRPRMVVFVELGAGQSNLVNMYYGNRWRLHRKITHMGVGLQERVGSYMDPIITEVIAVMQRAAELNVSGRRFPMAMESFPRGQGRGRPFFYALAEEAANNPTLAASDSYARKLFTEAAKHNLTRMEISSLAGNLFGAGNDTSSSTLVTFALACCAFPETLPAAWEELDRAVGPHRSPDFEDQDELHYVRAFVKEVFRWRSVAVIGGQPHAPVRDDWDKGYFIPKATWIQGNVWAIHHNTRDFPEPDRFNPSRFLPNSPDARPFPGEKGYMTFGWRRRVCSGQGLAEQGTFITIARLLWGFRIERALDEGGEGNGLNMRPNPFKCRITPRSDEIRETIEREGMQALRDLAKYDGETKYRMSTYYKEEEKL
ncbi:cytochrome P450 [Aspergillus undulatus]|uniref:cytochrome P450 n=1 Tax=Aspergillus undulatus TaxID=1810928 RepID=UPI003CCCF2BF